MDRANITGKVIQIAPTHKWGGCLAVVDEQKQWGVQAGVPIPEKGIAYIRLVWGDFEVVGNAIWVEEICD